MFVHTNLTRVTLQVELNPEKNNYKMEMEFFSRKVTFELYKWLVMTVRFQYQIFVMISLQYKFRKKVNKFAQL